MIWFLWVYWVGLLLLDAGHLDRRQIGQLVVVERPTGRLPEERIVIDGREDVGGREFLAVGGRPARGVDPLLAVARDGRLADSALVLEGPRVQHAGHRVFSEHLHTGLALT